MKQTAVEWLAIELWEKFEMRGDGLLYDDILNQAKEMEKQQIIDAMDVTQRTDFYVKYESSEHYYNETFKKK